MHLLLHSPRCTAFIHQVLTGSHCPSGVPTSYSPPPHFPPCFQDIFSKINVSKNAILLIPFLFHVAHRIHSRGVGYAVQWLWQSSSPWSPLFPSQSHKKHGCFQSVLHILGHACLCICFSSLEDMLFPLAL